MEWLPAVSDETRKLARPPPPFYPSGHNGRSGTVSPRVSGVLETSLYCDDLPRAVAFYRDLFGFELFFQEARMAALEVPGGQVLLLFDQDPRAAKAAAEIKALLKLSPELVRIPVAHDFTQPEHDRVTLRMRSVLSSMFYLSQGVDVPAEHEALGVVTVTRNPDGSRFDWQHVLGDLFRVHTGARAPERTYVKAFHRGAWFWIEDNDLEAKTTFLLLVQLFSMQASHKDQLVPMLTLPVGR